MIGWHFSNTNCTLNYGDGREITEGITHEVKPPIWLCERGLHASERIIDALKYAPAPILWRVELSGKIKRGRDKSVATHRRYIKGIDATKILNQFALACALSVAHLWDPPDVVMRFLLGDESARAAAGDAARDAERAAAGDAARAAARAAAGAAAWAAARAAARAAAWAAARAAAGAAAWAAARAAAGAAAWDAAGAAAWDAERAEQNAVLTEYVLDEMGIKR